VFLFERDLQYHARLIPIPLSTTGALVMEITYGMDIKSHEDQFLQSAEHAAKHADRIMVPGAFLVDTFPIRSFAPLIPLTLDSVDDLPHS
jgi:hypothetical protein